MLLGLGVQYRTLHYTNFLFHAGQQLTIKCFGQYFHREVRQTTTAMCKVRSSFSKQNCPDKTHVSIVYHRTRNIISLNSAANESPHFILQCFRCCLVTLNLFQALTELGCPKDNLEPKFGCPGREFRGLGCQDCHKTLSLKYCAWAKLVKDVRYEKNYD